MIIGTTCLLFLMEEPAVMSSYERVHVSVLMYFVVDFYVVVLESENVNDWALISMW